MIVLGLDTSTSATAVALALADGRTLEARDDPPAGAHPGHATRLLAMAEELLRRAGIGWPEIGLIGVGVGPGTFTGLRVGVASARGLAQSLGCELAGVSSPRALARPALEGHAGGVLGVIDARRGEVFLAAYGNGGEELIEARPLAPGLIREALGELAGGSGWLAVGDGAIRYRRDLEAAGVEVPEDPSPLHRLRGSAVCELAVLRELDGGPGEVLPDYRRRPDAELTLASAPSSGVHGR